MKEEKKIEEFLKLENKLTLKLRIKPLSPLCIKLSCDDSNSLNALLTTEGGKKIKSNNEDTEENNNKKANNEK